MSPVGWISTSSVQTTPQPPSALIGTHGGKGSWRRGSPCRCNGVPGKSGSWWSPARSFTGSKRMSKGEGAMLLHHDELLLELQQRLVRADVDRSVRRDQDAEGRRSEELLPTIRPLTRTTSPQSRNPSLAAQATVGVCRTAAWATADVGAASIATASVASDRATRRSRGEVISVRPESGEFAARMADPIQA